MKLADYVISRLRHEYGVGKVFEVYGAANGDLIDAFTRTPGIEYVSVIHEQGGGFMAEGYAKVTGNLGVALATSGPGGGNFFTCIQNAFYDSVPILFITGQVHTQFQRNNPLVRQLGFQETDIVGCVKSITKYAVMVTDPLSIKYHMDRAIYEATHNRKGPVLLDIPINIQKMDVDEKNMPFFEPDNSTEFVFIDKVESCIDQLMRDLQTSARPVFLIGGGVRSANAAREFDRVSKLFQIPCFPTWNALDVVTSDNPYYGGKVGTYGGEGRNFGIQNCDMVIAVGSRISGRIPGGDVKNFLRGARGKIYRVDVDEGLLNPQFQEVKADYNIRCDAKVFFELLQKRFEDQQSIQSIPKYFNWNAQVREWRDKYDPVFEPLFRTLSAQCSLDWFEKNQEVLNFDSLKFEGIDAGKSRWYMPEEKLNPYLFFRVLYEEMSSIDILVGDCGGNIVLSNHAAKTKFGQRNITNNGNSPMGFSFAGAIGAWFAAKEMNVAGNVICTIGDGGMQMNIQELQTVKAYNVGIKVFVINNHIYGITKQFQETNFQGRCEACGPKGYTVPNFEKIVEAYGISFCTLSGNSVHQMRLRIKEVLSFEGPVVCVVECPDWHTYEPRISGFSPIEDMTPKLTNEEFASNMIIEIVSRG